MKVILVKDCSETLAAIVVNDDQADDAVQRIRTVADWADVHVFDSDNLEDVIAMFKEGDEDVNR